MRGILLILAGIAVLGAVWLVASKDTEETLSPVTESASTVDSDGLTAGGTSEESAAAGSGHSDNASGQQSQAGHSPGETASVASEAASAESSQNRKGLIQQPRAEDREPVWKSWPTPTFALLISGEQHGYFEPCGCTASQLGGMSRRADLVRQIREAGWTLRGVDLGGTVKRAGRQAQLKFQTTTQALRDLDYIAIGLGAEELRLKADFLLSTHVPDGDTGLPFVSANIVFFDAPDLGTPLTHRTTEIGGAKVGVTSVAHTLVRNEIIPLTADGTPTPGDISWSEPDKALETVMGAFDAEQADVRILLSHGTVEDARRTAEAFPDLDAVVTANGIGDPDPNQPAERIGNTLLLQPGSNGKHVGILAYYADAEGPERFRFQVVSLERDAFGETESMIDHMRVYQGRLRDEQLVVRDGEFSHPSGAAFVGSQKCGECHSEAFAVWDKTPHAAALKSLDPVHERHGFERLNGVPRMFDPECLCCHVTGWEPQEVFRYRSGYMPPEFATDDEARLRAALLAGSGCENCHGPGSRHIEMVENGADGAGDSVRVTYETAKETLCYRCHDIDNSPDFDFDVYWPQVEHKGLD